MYALSLLLIKVKYGFSILIIPYNEQYNELLERILFNGEVIISF